MKTVQVVRHQVAILLLVVQGSMLVTGTALAVVAVRLR
jgi:hypothetical protein